MLIIPLAISYELLIKKEYSTLFKYTCISCIILLPFLLRNIIISGYLIYPVYQLDIFSFDWKLPKSVIISDNKIIKYFAREWGYDYSYIKDGNLSSFQWIKNWFIKAPTHFQIVAFAGFFSSIFFLFNILKNVIQKNRSNILLKILSIIGYYGFIFSAPSPRFGLFWVLLPSILFIQININYVMNLMFFNKVIYNIKLNKKLFTLLTCYFTIFTIKQYTNNIDNLGLNKKLWDQ